MLDVLCNIFSFSYIVVLILSIIYLKKWLSTKKQKINDRVIVRNKKIFLLLLIVQFVLIILVGVTAPEEKSVISEKDNKIEETIENSEKDDSNKNLDAKDSSSESNNSIVNSNQSNIQLSSIPKYDGNPYVVLNNNKPYFTSEELSVKKSYEKYSNLDSLGRCGVAIANIGKDLMPTEDRGSIGSIKPSGWHTVKYAGIDGNYLYNRAHLIGFQLTGENANTKNLITGTRYLNITGMLPFENLVADYIKETNNHVLYRVTPIFEESNLVASGVIIEAQSMEDDGKGVMFNVYCYNVQPGISIDYKTGDSSGPEYTGSSSNSNNSAIDNNSMNNNQSSEQSNMQTTQTNNSNEITSTFILNTNTKKYHNSGCSAVKRIAEKNYQEYTGTESSLIKQGYTACQICH